jgi:hypothetical protein
MGFLSKIFGGLTGGIVDSVADVVDKFVETPDDKAKMKLEIEKIVTQRLQMAEDSAQKEMEAKSAVIVSEMQQNDNYTKRARPTVVYAGLVFIGINYVLFPVIGRLMQAAGVSGVDSSPLANLPPDFWIAWGGICATWSIGRTFEKRGVQNKVTSKITGSKNIFD